MRAQNYAHTYQIGGQIYSKCIEGSSHYLGDKQDFDVSSKGPLSGN